MIDLRLGDCLEIMQTMPDKSVDAVITDPERGMVELRCVQNLSDCLSYCTPFS